MNDVPILVCGCGKRLKAPGATPGRVGRCPACGGLMRVAEADLAAPVPPPEDAPGPPPAPAPATPRKKRRRRTAAGTRETAIWDGLIPAPRAPEGTVRASLRYPLWGGTGVAALVVLPPLLWITSLPAIGGLVALFGGDGSPPALMGLLMFLPTGLGLFAVLGYTLLFLGRVLASSALGESHHPRWPDWELSSMAFGLGRWLWAGLIGGVVGGIPAVAYWIRCGDIDAFDMIILAELAAVGAAYGLMALLAAVLHEDILAANPVTVLLAIRAIGWDYAPSCLVAGASAVLCATLGLAAFEVESPPAAAFLAWLSWAAWLYAAMVSLRVLGLCYARHARSLGWFRGRTGWGI